MNILFVNGSPNKAGNTAKLAEQFLMGKEYKTLHLTDYKVYSYGQNFEGDQFAEVISEIQKNDMIVFGSPLYWHNICGALRNVLDRTYGYLEPGAFAGKKMFFIFQGAAPEQWMLDAGEYTMKRFASISGMEYGGMITNKKDADLIAESIRNNRF